MTARHATIPYCVAAVAALALSAPAQVQWVARAPMLDPRTNTGVEGAAGVVRGTKLYVSHGTRGTVSALLSIYDIPSDTWTHGGATAPSGGVERYAVGGGYAVDNIWVIGGRRTLGPTTTMEAFNTTPNAWSSPVHLTVARAGCAVASFPNFDQLVIAGGRTGATFGAGSISGVTEAYDGCNNAIAAMAPMPTPVSDAAAVAFGSKAYVFGGATSPSATITDVQIYDLPTNTWSAGAPMPTHRAAAMAAVFGNRIAVVGGFDPMLGTNLDVTEFYDPVTDTWSAGPPMIQPASEMAVGLTHGQREVFAVGSGMGQSGTMLQVLTCDPGVATYCTAKVNSCGALPALTATGTPSASLNSGFTVTATGTKAFKFGILIYTDSGRGNAPFQGGLLCIDAQGLARATASLDTTGTQGNCDGTLSIDMNAFAAGGLGGNPRPFLRTIGTTVDCQFWARDTPAHGSLLTGGLEYVVCH